MHLFYQRFLSLTLVSTMVLPSVLFAQQPEQTDFSSHEQNIEKAMRMTDPGFIPESFSIDEMLQDGTFWKILAVSVGSTSLAVGTQSVLSAMQTKKRGEEAIKVAYKAIDHQFEFSDYVLINDKKRLEKYVKMYFNKKGVPESQRFHGIDKLLGDVKMHLNDDGDKKLFIANFKNLDHSPNINLHQLTDLVYVMRHDASPEVIRKLPILFKFVEKFGLNNTEEIIHHFGPRALDSKNISDWDIAHNAYLEASKRIKAFSGAVSPLPSDIKILSVVLKKNGVHPRVKPDSYARFVDQLLIKNANREFFKKGLNKNPLLEQDILNAKILGKRLLGATAMGVLATVVIYNLVHASTKYQTPSSQMYNLSQTEIFAMVQNDPAELQSLLERDPLLAKDMAMVSDKLKVEFQKVNQKISSFDRYTKSNQL